MNALIIAAVMLGATSQPATQPTTRPAKALPATYIEENAEKLGPEALAWLRQMTWGEIKAPQWGKPQWGRSMSLALVKPKGSPVAAFTLDVVCLAIGADKAPHTVQGAGLWGGAVGMAALCERAQKTFIAMSPAPRPANVYVAVSFRGVRLYECLLRYDATAQLKPNGIPWWQDESLRVPAVP